MYNAYSNGLLGSRELERIKPPPPCESKTETRLTGENKGVPPAVAHKETQRRRPPSEPWWLIRLVGLLFQEFLESLYILKLVENVF